MQAHSMPSAGGPPRPRPRRMHPAGLLLATVPLAVACGEESPGRTAAAAEGPVDDRPNVVMILVDTLRRDHLGTYGYGRDTSPNLDRLGAAGVVFEDVWSQASQTFPSVSSLLTSRDFPHLLDNEAFEPVPGLKQRSQEKLAAVPAVAEENVTLAEVLSQAGYETLGLFTNPHQHPTSGFWQGFEHAKYFPGGKRAYARGSAINESFEEWLEVRDRRRPFFAYLHYMDVHNPYDPPEPFRSQFVRTEGRDVYTNGRPEEGRIPTEADIAFMQELYDGEIRYFDELLAGLQQLVREDGEYENTIWVITSDHGDEFLEHGGLGHGKTLEPELLRVPLVLAGAGVATGRRVPGLVRNLDVAPTVLSLVDVAAPAVFEGVDLLPLVEDPSAVRPGTSHARVSDLLSATTDRWHLMLDTGDQRRVLYDRGADPAGTTDVLAQQGADAGGLVEALDRHSEAQREAARFDEELQRARGGARDIDPEYVEQLRALGYLGGAEDE